MPACSECRRRKLGCSKEHPRCKECRRLGADCVYEPKEKPGLKGGAVENLNRRVEKLEDLIQSLQGQTTTASAADENPQSASALLKSFERELRKFNNATSRGLEGTNEETLSDASSIADERFGKLRKRQRLDSSGLFNWGTYLLGDSFVNDGDELLASNIVQSIVSSYFSQLHPWIPMIHESSFKRKLSESVWRADLEVILRAMIVSAIRFSCGNRKVDDATILEVTKTSRDSVILHAMNSLSVESLQALTIIAFDDIGHGNPSSAWSIVGSLTRTVEYLQLSVEIDEEQEHPLLTPAPLLSPPTNWTEVETRRRVFWNVFNLDRFCSVATGWNTSLTSDDVYRRLPADGALWRKQEHVLTPYFGIWDKSAGKIGNSIAYLPTHYPSPTQGLDHQSPASTRFGNSENAREDLAASMSTIGAFAYRIEATESMSRVTTYFLQQKVDLQDQKQVGSWLTRFKELDLRLVHWKMFLPQKWKDTNISRRPAEIIMDPNLTLAHITHNASMILLHQVIAYPSPQWDWASKLPSRWSADTCQAAAIETSSITENYLNSPTTSKIVNSQFVLCVFVAARVLLVHWRFYEDATLMLEFTKLLKSLDVISTRWKGGQQGFSAPQNDLAARYADELRSLQYKCTENPRFRIDVMGYAKKLGTSEADDPLSSPSRHATMMSISGKSPESISASQRQKKRKHSHIYLGPGNRSGEHSGNSDTSGYSPGVSSTHRRSSSDLRNDRNFPMSGRISLQAGHPAIVSPAQMAEAATHSGPTLGDDGFMHPAANVQTTDNIMGMDDLNPISQMFVDQQFLEMDRVISYDDGLFSANMGWWGQEN